MVDLFKPLCRLPAVTLWDDIQAAQALVSQLGAADGYPNHATALQGA